MALDDGLVNAVTPWLKETGATNDTVQKLATLYASYATEQYKLAEQQSVEQAQQWVAELKKDPAFDNVVKNANRAVALAGPGAAELRQVLNETGLGNHPVLVRWAAAIGERLSETPFVPGQGGAGTYKERSVAQTMYPNM